MATPKKTKAQLEAIPEPGKKAPSAAEAQAQADAEVMLKRKRGRPRKSEVRVPIATASPFPEETIDAMVLGLLIQTPSLMMQRFFGVTPNFPPASVEQLAPAFRAWAATWELSLSPGAAFAALYMQTLMSGMMALTPVAPPPPAEAPPAPAGENVVPFPPKESNEVPPRDDGPSAPAPSAP